MNWTTSYRSEEDILYFKTSGAIDKESVLKLIKEAAQIMGGYHCSRCLVDHRDIDSFDIEPVDIDNIPKVYNEAGISRTLRVAMIVPNEYLESFKILELVNNNSGYTFSVHLEAGSALEWLNHNSKE